tara:strand:+ start:335 stop:2770 length:2436 start_codon:yes stop_codon:yes gene_type:complete
MSSFNDRINQIKLNNFNTKPVNLPQFQNPYLLLSKNEAYNKLLNKNNININKNIKNENQNGIGLQNINEDNENLATHVMSEVYLSPDKRRPIEGYDRLREYGTDETVVYTNENNVVIGMRGSTLDHFGRDYMADAEITTGLNILGSKERRFKMANSVYEKLRARFPNKRIILGGHSLGNAIILDVLKNHQNDSNLRAYGFNGLKHPDYNKDSRYFGRRREGDIISYLGKKLQNTTVDGDTQATIDNLHRATYGLMGASAVGLGLDKLPEINFRARNEASRYFWNNWKTQTEALNSETSTVAEYTSARKALYEMAKEIPRRFKGMRYTDITEKLRGGGIIKPDDLTNRYFINNNEGIAQTLRNYGVGGHSEGEFVKDINENGLGSSNFQSSSGGEPFDVVHQSYFDEFADSELFNVEMADGMMAKFLPEASFLEPALGALGLAGLTAYGGYWLWSHSSSRFKPKKNLFRNRPIYDANAPATSDELLDAKYRRERFMNVAKPVMMGTSTALNIAGAVDMGEAYMTEQAIADDATEAFNARIDNAFNSPIVPNVPYNAPILPQAPIIPLVRNNALNRVVSMEESKEGEEVMDEELDNMRNEERDKRKYDKDRKEKKLKKREKKISRKEQKEELNRKAERDSTVAKLIGDRQALRRQAFIDRGFNYTREGERILTDSNGKPLYTTAEIKVMEATEAVGKTKNSIVKEKVVKIEKKIKDSKANLKMAKTEAENKLDRKVMEKMEKAKVDARYADLNNKTYFKNKVKKGIQYTPIRNLPIYTQYHPHPNYRANPFKYNVKGKLNKAYEEYIKNQKLN